MPTISVKDGLEYFYTDNGSPKTVGYHTLIVLHGHTFHSGTFQRFSPVAFSKSIRVICINRRHYPGTTPLTDIEKSVITSGDSIEREILVENIGKDLAFAVVGLIHECEIPQGGGITLVGWSQGTLSLLALVSGINSFDTNTKEILEKYVTGVLMWDPPSPALGIPSHPDGYLPFTDPNIPQQSLSAVFGSWVSSYFTHGDFTSLGISEINFNRADQSRKSTVQTMSFEELSSIIDLSMITDYETAMVEADFLPITDKLARKALFDPETRIAWGNAEFFFLLGECSPWVFTYAYCIVAKHANALTFPINFKRIPDANHFLMWERPYECAAILQDFLQLNSEI